MFTLHSSLATSHHSLPRFTGLNPSVNLCPLLQQGAAGKNLRSPASNFPGDAKALWPWDLPPRPLEAQPLSGVKHELNH